MRAHYSRLFTDANGASKIADFDIELAPNFAVPPVEPLHMATFERPDSTFWIGAPTTWRGQGKHPAPRRAIFITVRGEFEVTTSDGTVRQFPIGSVLVVEDTTGEGHSTTITSSEDCYVFCVGLPPTIEKQPA